jgi:hypothetical protein
MTDFGRTTGTTGTTRNWRDYQDTYRSDFEQRYGTNRSWDEYGPAYRYGWESAYDDRFRNREFSDAERDLERDFSDRYDRFANEHRGHAMSDHQSFGGKMEHAWENFKDTVREGWDRARMDR